MSWLAQRIALLLLKLSRVQYTLCSSKISKFTRSLRTQRYRLLGHEDLSSQLGPFQVYQYQYQDDSLKTIRAERLGPVLYQSFQMAAATHMMYEKPARHRAEEKSLRTT